MPAITMDATISEPEITCGYCHRAYGLLTSCQRLVSSARPPFIRYPTGCCIQALVATMKKPETTAPSATMIDESQCRPRLTRFSANRNTPRKDDSAKKAKQPSMKGVCPTTGPARWEKAAQFVPN